MVLKKRLSNGLRGFQVPVIPRYPRSARTRVPFEKPAEDGHACAFELLASLAGKLLQEGESSTSRNVSEVKLISKEQYRSGNCDEKRSGTPYTLTSQAPSGLKHKSCGQR